MTPPEIRLIDATLALGPPSLKPAADAGKTTKDAKRAANGKQESSKQLLAISGVVTGERQSHESILVRYMLSLNDSGLFDLPMVEKGQTESHGGDTFMHFDLNLVVNCP